MNVVMAGVIATGGAVPVASASSSATVLQSVYSVTNIEINVFGSDPARCAVLFWAYYHGEWHVIDWRWCEAVGIKFGVAWDGRAVIWGNVPQIIDGQYYLVWNDQGVMRVVKSNEKSFEQSRGDRELAERARLPAEQRPKLGGTGYSASSTLLVFPSPTPTPELANPMVAP